MTDQEPPPKRPTRVRLWLFSLLLFAAGFGGKLVLEAQPGAAEGYIITMLWQLGWYASGLVTWFWWANTRPVGERGGCWVGGVLISFAVLAVLSSGPK